MGVGVPPKGKYMFGMVKVGDKGQIVIPAKARKIFNIKPGDNLVILGDENSLDLPGTKVTNNNHKVVLTLGMRF